MDKNKTSSDVSKLIKKIIQAEIKNVLKLEIKKVLKPILKEYVRNEVNAVLAEQFVATLSRSKETLLESINADDEPSIQPKSFTRKSTSNSSQAREERRKQLLEKLGAQNNPAMQMIYEDIDDSNVSMKPLSGPFAGAYVDSDDDGVDLSFLGV